MTNTNTNANNPPSTLQSHHYSNIATTPIAFVLSRIRSFTYYANKVLELIFFLFNLISTRVHPFWIELLYYLILSLLGSWAMMLTKPRVLTFKPRFIDMLYMSTAAVTISGLNSVDTENFSEPQILILTFLMLVGGEVFVSLLTLLFRRTGTTTATATSHMNSSSISLPVIRIGSSNRIESIEIVDVAASNQSIVIMGESERGTTVRSDVNWKATRLLEYVVAGYLVGFHVAGFIPVLIYFYTSSSAKNVLYSKGLRISTFAASLVVSSFANVGILPSNENMGRFKANSGLLLMLIPLILAGNTLYPACLRLVIWCLGRVTRRLEFDLMLKNTSELEYPHIFPTTKTLSICMTSVVILMVQISLYCVMNWQSEVLSGLNSYQKLVGVFFQSVNARHCGEVLFDLSITAPAVLVFFILAMYLPGYTSFMPLRDGEDMKKMNKKSKLKKNLNVSMVMYVVFFVIIGCISERKKLANDPLNFTVLNMVFETMSAYGNVGLSMGYSCGRLLTQDSTCKDGGYSFSGRWSDGGKLLIVFVMVFGKLKRYHMGGGKAWKLA